MRRVRRVGVALAVSALLACGGGGGEEGGHVRVTIPGGASFQEATDSLARSGLVGWPRLFRIYARVTGGDRDIKAGTYRFPRDARWSELIGQLRSGDALDRSVTIPEGFQLRDMAAQFERRLGIPADSFLVAARDTSLLRELDIPSGSLEGYLFPDTYRFTEGSAARDVVREMVRRFTEVWEPAWDERAREMAMNRHDIVTLASIVEKEARLPEERAVISAVYHNRLRDQMPLQADPTVQYALGTHKARVLYRDLEVESPYNTYRNRGLPPGPIASPGRASLEAALYPANVPYKFFVAHPDGHHEFRTTFREHTEARRLVNRARREATEERRAR